MTQSQISDFSYQKEIDSLFPNPHAIRTSERDEYSWSRRMIRMWELRRVLPCALSATVDTVLIMLFCSALYFALIGAHIFEAGDIAMFSNTVTLVLLGIIVRLFHGWWGKLYPGYGLGPVNKLSLRARTWFFVVVLTGVLVYTTWPALAAVLWLQILMLPVDLIVLPLAQKGVRTFLQKRDLWGRPVAVIVEGETGQGVLQDLMQTDNREFYPAYILELEGENLSPVQHDREWGFASGWTDLRKSSSVLCTCIVATTSNDSSAVNNIHRRLAFLPFQRLLLVRNNMQVRKLNTRTCWVGKHLAVEVSHELFNPLCMLWKRIFDLAISIPAAMIATPFVVAAAIAIKIVDPKGSPFYIQQREGLGGVNFGVWKLRSMYSDSDARLEELLKNNPQAREEWQTYCKLRNDPRIIPVVGTLIRRFSIDELPQIYQIVLGKMSVVGPRPFPSYHTAHYKAGFRALRRMVKPGLTGLWQVEVRSEGDIAIQEKFDTEYIESWSLWLDLYIVFRTVPVVLRGSSAC